MLNFLLHFISFLVINEEMDTLDIFILRFSIRIRTFILQNSTSFVFIFKSILAALILLFIALITQKNLLPKIIGKYFQESNQTSLSN